VITEATIKHIKDIVKIHKKCVLVSNSKLYGPEIISSWVNNINEKNVLSQWENSTWLVIKENNKVVGFAQYSLKEKELFQIQVNPDYQGKGFGKNLYIYIEQDFLKNEIENISLNSTLNAKQFYKEMGFFETGKIDYNGIHMFRMEKLLV